MTQPAQPWHVSVRLEDVLKTFSSSISLAALLAPASAYSRAGAGVAVPPLQRIVARMLARIAPTAIKPVLAERRADIGQKEEIHRRSGVRPPCRKAGHQPRRAGRWAAIVSTAMPAVIDSARRVAQLRSGCPYRGSFTYSQTTNGSSAPSRPA
jgi:hypothetical protein